MAEFGPVAKLLLVLPLALVALGLVALLSPLRARRLLVGLALLHAGVLVLLVDLAGRFGAGGWLAGAGSVVDASAGVLGGRLHGLAVAVTVLGFLFAAMLAAVLHALERRAGSLRPEALEDLADAEWRAALGADVAAPRERDPAAAGRS